MSPVFKCLLSGQSGQSGQSVLCSAFILRDATHFMNVLAIVGYRMSVPLPMASPKSIRPIAYRPFAQGNPANYEPLRVEGLCTHL